MIYTAQRIGLGLKKSKLPGFCPHGQTSASSLNPLGSKAKTAYLRHRGPEHILVFAPTRSGSQYW